MLGIRFIRFNPTTFVMHYQNGAIRREGRGLSFFYYAPNSSIVALPVGTSDLPFVFTLATRDFQTVTVQGQLTYRVSEPKKLAEMLDFSVDPRGTWQTRDPEKLGQRLINEAQTASATFVAGLGLRDALAASDRISRTIVDGLRESKAVTMIGVEPLGVSILAIAATPEMARALEAEAREGLQQEADKAIYARRNYAVEQERLIKESELNTEIAVEEKKRMIRETQMKADVAVEEKRGELIDLQSENDRKQADTRSYSLAAVVNAVKGVDWKLLAALGPGIGPETLIANAFEQIAANAERIQTLNLSPDLLDSLLASGKHKKPA